MLNSSEDEKIGNTDQTINIMITEDKHAGIVKWQASRLADANRFSEASKEKIRIIIDELCKNLIHYASDAETKQLIIQVCQQNNKKVFEIIAIDNGCGVANLDVCLEQNYKIENKQENGFGKILQVADYFKVYTQRNSGVVVLTAVYENSLELNQALPLFPHNVGGICLPIPIEKANGDSWSYHQTQSQSTILLADGLGHGPNAAIASNLACKVFQDNVRLPILQIIDHINTALQTTVGAAIAIAKIDNDIKEVRFAGLGNILGHIYDQDKHNYMLSHNGTAGYAKTKAREIVFAWHENATLVMHSDGLASRWELTNYRNLASFHSTIIASLLYRDYYRGKDDVTVVVVKNVFSNSEVSLR